jgi:hypothetical protein
VGLNPSLRDCGSAGMTSRAGGFHSTPHTSVSEVRCKIAATFQPKSPLPLFFQRGVGEALEKIPPLPSIGFFERTLIQDTRFVYQCEDLRSRQQKNSQREFECQ